MGPRGEWADRVAAARLGGRSTYAKGGIQILFLARR